MPLWVSDFLGDTLDLDATEIGAYMLLLMAQWNRDGKSLPDDDAKLRRVARCGRNWPTVWGNISGYFERDSDGVYSAKGRLVFASVNAKRIVNAQSGAMGGKAKALNLNELDLANASETLERKATILKPEPYKKKREAIASPKNTVRGSRLASDWTLPSDWLDWSVKAGLSEPDISREAERFRDYWISKPGREAIKVDWQATWRNWMRKRIDDAKPRPVPQQDFWTGKALA